MRSRAELDEATLNSHPIQPISTHHVPPWPDVEDVIQHCLKTAPEKRPTVSLKKNQLPLAYRNLFTVLSSSHTLMKFKCFIGSFFFFQSAKLVQKLSKLDLLCLCHVVPVSKETTIDCVSLLVSTKYDLRYYLKQNALKQINVKVLDGQKLLKV